MGTRIISSARFVRTTATAVVIIGLGLSLVSAAAASLGGISSEDIHAESGPTSVPTPTVVAQDIFFCSGRLDGHTTPQGLVWSEHWGRWLCVGDDLVRATRRLPLAHASVDVGLSDHLIVTTSLDRISSLDDRSGPGLSLFTTGFFHLYVIYERDQGRVTIGRWSPWANTALASVPISDRATAVISVVIDQPSLTVLVDGTQVITYDLSNLTPGEQALFLENTRFGLESDDDTWSRFDTFMVGALP